MGRRAFVKAASTIAAGVGIAGCAGREDAGTGPGIDEGDETERIVRPVPEDEGGAGTTPADFDVVRPVDIGIDDVRFQRAGQKGLVVAGDAVNQGDRAFEEFSVEVTLIDETEDDLLDRTSERAEHDGLEAGTSWSWAVTFGDDPLANIGYFAVMAVGEYD